MESAFHNSHVTEYRQPFGAVERGTNVKLSIRTYNDAEVYLNLIDFYDKQDVIRMDLEVNNGESSKFSTVIETDNLLGMNRYYFTIKRVGKQIYYGNNVDGLGGEGQKYYDNPVPYQITVYEKSYVPEWYKDGIIYQIYVDRFFNGNNEGKINNPRKNSFIYGNWSDDPMYIKGQNGEILRWDFYGGNLKGVKEKLPYLKDLGVTIIYFNPIFEAVSCHKYDTGDYERIDPMYGDEEDFRELCIEAGNYGIKIILDGVFSHTGSDSKYFNKFGRYDSVGAYQDKNSPYYEWYRFYNYPDKYECWWGFDNQPDVDELNPSYLDYIVNGKNSIISKWMNLGASGWRLDVADELPDEFIEALKKKTREVNPESIVIGEVWEDASNKISYSQRRKYLFGKELDSVTNYPFRNAILKYVKSEIDANVFSRTIFSLYENYPIENFYSTMNILGNHDTERVLTVLNEDIRLLELALILQMVLPGVPLIYYGDEAGLLGNKDPENRKAYPWGRENKSVYNLYKKMIEVRKSNLALVKGDFNINNLDNGLVMIRRTYNEKSIVFIANNLEQDKNVELNNTIDKQYKDIISNEVLTKNQNENYIFTIEKKGYRLFEEYLVNNYI